MEDGVDTRATWTREVPVLGTDRVEWGEGTDSATDRVSPVSHLRTTYFPTHPPTDTVYFFSCLTDTGNNWWVLPLRTTFR